jgi:putative methyltransferase (TIGR04325 family)
MAKIKELFKAFIPPILLKVLNRMSGLKQEMWSGDFATWAEAVKASTGYNSDEILEKCKLSLLKVKNGEAVYERDSILFDRIEYSWPLLSAMLLVAAQNNGKLKLLDFGGSLGSTYYQNRKFLNEIKEINYNIVEQEHFVEVGNEIFEDNILKFYKSIEECLLGQQKIELLILSSTIQYLESPPDFIVNLLRYNIPYILVDLTPFYIDKGDRLTIQQVSPKIYPASYPCWILNYDKFRNQFLNNYDIFSEHENGLSINVDGQTIIYRGFLLKLKD